MAILYRGILTTPSPKTPRAATPQRSMRSFRCCRLSSNSLGRCSTRDCAIFSKPRPQARQKLWSLEMMVPQLGQYMGINSFAFPADNLKVRKGGLSPCVECPKDCGHCHGGATLRCRSKPLINAEAQRRKDAKTQIEIHQLCLWFSPASLLP